MTRAGFENETQQINRQHCQSDVHTNLILICLDQRKCRKYTTWLCLVIEVCTYSHYLLLTKTLRRSTNPDTIQARTSRTNYLLVTSLANKTYKIRHLFFFYTKYLTRRIRSRMRRSLSPNESQSQFIMYLQRGFLSDYRPNAFYLLAGAQAGRSKRIYWIYWIHLLLGARIEHDLLASGCLCGG